MSKEHYMHSKRKRRAKILEIIEGGNIQTQGELVARLNSAGFGVTQATVSRDIKGLGLIKTAAAQGLFVYAQPMQHTQGKFCEKLGGIFASSVTSITPAGNMIVVKTLSGAAQAAASAIDSAHIKGIVGSIAGDDTIMIVTKNEKDCERICSKLGEMRHR